jgi:hypothetical protein
MSIALHRTHAADSLPVAGQRPIVVVILVGERSRISEGFASLLIVLFGESGRIASGKNLHPRFQSGAAPPKYLPLTLATLAAMESISSDLTHDS